jgi:membrane protease YdiL (CAAX protease family)
MIPHERAPSERLGTPSSSEPREDRRLLLIELGALMALTVADTWGLVPLSRTPFLLLLCWASLRWRRLAWRDIGLRLPPRPARAIAVGIVAGLAIELLAVNVTTPWITALTGMPPDVSDLRPLVGNVQLLLILVVASWILAAFGEELAFRGYLMNRFADGFGRTRIAWIASLVVVSIYFGIGHGTQGVAGIVQESLSGCWLGVCFLVTGRNLTVPIVAHGVSNTLALILIYWNRYPGLS